MPRPHRLKKSARPLRHGDIVIASIASCTNTANPHQMIAAGLLARNAVAQGAAREAVDQNLILARLPRRAGDADEGGTERGTGRSGI